LIRYAWYSVNANLQTHPAGEKQPNAFGLHDMHGNVLEWCWDRYGAKYYEQSPGIDPQGPNRGSKRVVRGGSPIYNAIGVRSAFRLGCQPDRGGVQVGFRVARFYSTVGLRASTRERQRAAP
jgi:formylglycine-generating enzyme required for sulfatase activity